MYQYNFCCKLYWRHSLLDPFRQRSRSTDSRSQKIHPGYSNKNNSIFTELQQAFESFSHWVLTGRWASRGFFNGFDRPQVEQKHNVMREAQDFFFLIDITNIQQQSSSSSSNRFIEHDVSTRKLGPSSGIRPSFLNRSIYTFLLLCLGVAKHRLKLFWKNAKLFLEISSCLCGFAVKLCWNT